LLEIDRIKTRLEITERTLLISSVKYSRISCY